MRDPAQTEDGYRKTIAQLTREIDDFVGRNLPRILFSVPAKCCGLAMAHYSLGDPVSETLQWFNKAVDYRLAYHEAVAYKISFLPQFESSFQLLGAAQFVGRAAELATSFRRCEFNEAPKLWELELTKLAWSAFADEPVEVPKPAEALIKKQAKELVTAVPLLKAVSEKDKTAFATTLQDYLQQSWAKALRGEKPGLYYSGLWNIAAGALCKKLGYTPDYPDALKRYIPQDLIAGTD